MLLSVIRGSDGPLPEALNRESLEYWRWSLQEKLHVAKMALEGKGFRMFVLHAQPMLRQGNPFKERLVVADESRASLKTLGSHEGSAIREMLTGSTLNDVARLSRQSMLAMRALESS